MHYILVLLQLFIYSRFHEFFFNSQMEKWELDILRMSKIDL